DSIAPTVVTGRAADVVAGVDRAGGAQPECAVAKRRRGAAARGHQDDRSWGGRVGTHRPGPDAVAVAVVVAVWGCREGKVVVDEEDPSIAQTYRGLRV